MLDEVFHDNRILIKGKECRVYGLDGEHGGEMIGDRQISDAVVVDRTLTQLMELGDGHHSIPVVPPDLCVEWGSHFKRPRTKYVLSLSTTLSQPSCPN